MLLTRTTQCFRLNRQSTKPGESFNIPSLDGGQASFRFDGELDDEVKSRLLSRDSITSLDQLGPMCQKAAPDLENALELLKAGADANVSLGRITWRAWRNESTLFLIHDLGDLPEQELEFSLFDPPGAQEVKLKTRATLDNWRKSLQQTITGTYNSQTGTITCIEEKIEIAQ